MFQMVTGYGTDDVVTNLVDTYDFHFLPVVNPDGYVYTFTDVSTCLFAVLKRLGLGLPSAKEIM